MKYNNMTNIQDKEFLDQFVEPKNFVEYDTINNKRTKNKVYA